MDGTVVNFYPEKGFGFIRPLLGRPQTSANVYFRVSSIVGGSTAPVGCRVSFKLVEAPGRGVQAADVKLHEVSGAKLYPPEPKQGPHDPRADSRVDPI